MSLTKKAFLYSVGLLFYLLSTASNEEYTFFFFKSLQADEHEIEVATLFCKR